MLRLPVSASGVALPRWLSWLLVGVLSVALCFGTDLSANAETPSPTPTPTESSTGSATAAADSDGDGFPDRPDVVSAALTARALGVSVEDLSQRTESVRVVLNPDGTSTQESFSAPVWVQDAEGKWIDVDYTLVAHEGGGFVPKAAPSSDTVVIDGGGSKEFARLDLPGGGSTIWSWPEALPAPTVDGPRATYKVGDGVDLLVTATRSGVSTRILIASADAVVPEYTVMVRTDGVDLSQTDAGQLFFTDGRDRVGATSTLTAWDARLDEAGDPLEVVAVDADLTEVSSAGERTDQELSLSAPAELVDDPQVEYPITIDPDITPLTAMQDTWVRSGSGVVDTETYKLLVGRIGSSTNTNAAQSYVQWANGQISGRKILNADLHLYQYFAGTCEPRSMYVRAVSSSWKETTAQWTNRPSYNTVTGSSTTTNRGGDGCTDGNGFIDADITAMTQGWSDGAANGGFANYGVQLNASSTAGSDGTFERRFCSINYDISHVTCNAATRSPYLTLTYNAAPNKAAAPGVSSSRSFATKLWTSQAKPTLSTSATDGEGSNVAYSFEVRTSTSATSNVATCTTATVAAGATGSCALATALTDGASYVVRAMATDQYGLVGAWSDWVSFGVDVSAPTIPSIACTGYANGSWTDTRTATSSTCTLTSTGAADFRWWIYQAGAFVEQSALTAASGAATTPAITIPATGGYFIIKAQARNKSVLTSAEKVYSFGIGTPQITLPKVDDRSTSTFPIQASASANPVSSATATARVEWRYAPTSPTDTTGWTKASRVKRQDSGADWTGSVEKTTVLSTPLLKWSAVEEPRIQIPSLVQVRVVFSYPGEGDQVSAIRRFQLVPHAFGGTYPTQEVGAGTLALFTGEFQVSQVDVSVPGRGGDLTVGRTHSTLTGDQAGPAGIFGPGWTADIAGQGAGLAGYSVIDHTTLDGTFVLTSPEGESDIFAHESNTSGSLNLGNYLGVGETALNEDTLVLQTGDATGITHKLILTEQDGTITEFQRTAAGVWSVASTKEPEANSTVRFVRNPDGLTSWVLAPAPDGVTCTEVTQQRGCKALKLSYATIAGGQRLTGVQYVAWDPSPGSDGRPTAAAGMATIDVAAYGYDTAGRLVETWAPHSNGDDGAGHKTTYTYTTINSKTVVETITDPGQKAWRFGYTNGVLATIKRQLDPVVGTGDATWTIAYDVPLSGAGLPNLQAGEVAKWGQLANDAPVGATAVFEPDHIPGSAPSSTDWPYATISYFAQAGRVTNTASYGAGAWQINSTRYDDIGNTNWALTASGRVAALAEPNPAAAADKYATLTIYNDAGTRVEQTYTPMLPVVLENGTTVTARTLVETDYDDEATPSLMPGRPSVEVPDGGYSLAVEERTSVTDRIGPSTNGSIWDTKKTRYRYDPVSADDASGWDLRVPTRVLTQDGSGWATTLSRYDSEGRIVETRSPGGTAITDGSANDSYSKKTIYYTADPSAQVSTCRSKPEWDGSTCMVKTAGDPATGYPIPSRAITGYSIRGTATRQEEASSTWTRATVTSYDYLGRAVSGDVSLTDQAKISGTTSYDPITGAITSTTGNGITEVSSYDTWGRQVTATDGTGNTASTSYDAAGRTKTFGDGKGTYTYTYDDEDKDVDHRTEHRGLVTDIDLGYADGTNDHVAGAYDTAGKLIRQILPGGYAQTWSRNLAGQAISLSYTQTVGTVTTPVLGFSQSYDFLGRVATAAGPGATKRYTYDDRARLTKVEDTGFEGCTTRRYGFTGDSNRNSFASYASAGDGTCQTTTAQTTSEDSYDQADRITGDGYVYDPMGRTATVPKAHTSEVGVAGAGDLAVTYTANDMVASLQQTVPDATGTATETKQTFSLDGSNRISSVAGYTNSDQLVETLNHYDGAGDSPAWTQTRTRPDTGTAWTTSWNRYVSDMSGGLAIDISSKNDAVLQLANLHGDIVATATLGETSINNYTETDEYGRAMPAGGGSPARRYGWLGKDQRDTSIIGGLVAMGARLYDAATGRFLSVDAVARGNDNRYTYPADPVNQVDLDGNQCAWTPTHGVEGCIHSYARLAREAAACGGYCAVASWISNLALKYVSADTNRGNGVRHFVWQVALSAVIGVGMAHAIGDAHDWDLIKYGGYLAKDSRRDLANNVYSRNYFRANRRLFMLMLHFYVNQSGVTRGVKRFMKYLRWVGNDLYDEGEFTRI